ncbi:MAG TPA: GNAT family N-acetyltransferase [Pseudonocardiaceae bacterium]|nr:GNAT family N-acetyltransferase [Pseudonocardiaceae bacterium]
MTKIIDNAEAHRYEIYEGEIEDGAERAGLVEYHLHGNEIAFLHTEVDPKFAGKGLGSALARHVLDDARRAGRAVLPYCPFIRDWIARHPEYVDLVPGSHRERFQL